jgi:hypothetical protein
MKKFILFFALVFVLSPQPKVWAEEYEEISYDELVNRIGKKRSQVLRDKPGANVLDDIMIHAGFALTNSNLTYVNGGQSLQKNVNGFQLSFGIDLFSPHWAAEGTLRNLGGSSDMQINSEVKSFREFNIEVMYKNSVSEGTFGYRMGFGFGNRYLRISDNNGSFEEYNPLLVAFTGLDFNINRNFSVGTELSFRNSLINETHDKNSVDLLVRLDTYF